MENFSRTDIVLYVRHILLDVHLLLLIFLLSLGAGPALLHVLALFHRAAAVPLGLLLQYCCSCFSVIFRLSLPIQNVEVTAAVASSSPSA